MAIVLATGDRHHFADETAYVTWRSTATPGHHRLTYIEPVPTTGADTRRPGTQSARRSNAGPT